MEPNPPPDPSMLPESLLELRIRPDPANALTPEEREALSLFQRVGNYMAAAMIYLRDNALLETELKVEDIKPRLLGSFDSLLSFLASTEPPLMKGCSYQAIGVHALDSHLYTVI